VSDPAPVDWEQIADMLYHAVHCSTDAHRIEAETAYWEAKKKPDAR
jgi:hypothetical protein